MENKKMIIDNLTLDEVGLLHTSLKGMIIKMKELEVPEFFIEMAIPLLDQIDNVPSENKRRQINCPLFSRRVGTQ